MRTTMIPTLEYRITGDTLHYRWNTVVPGFEFLGLRGGCPLLPNSETGRLCGTHRPMTTARLLLSLTDVGDTRMRHARPSPRSTRRRRKPD